MKQPIIHIIERDRRERAEHLVWAAVYLALLGVLTACIYLAW